MSLEQGITHRRTEDKKSETSRWFATLIQPHEYVGELFSINYETARVIIHDSERKKVGGIPSLSFLIATRIDPNKTENIDFIIFYLLSMQPLDQPTLTIQFTHNTLVSL